MQGMIRVMTDEQLAEVYPQVLELRASKAGNALLWNVLFELGEAIEAERKFRLEYL